MPELTAQMIEAVDDLNGRRAEWDALAIASGRPFSAPAWALGWWKHLGPSDGELRLVFVREGDRLVGVLPLFAARRSYAPLAAEVAPAEPLVAADVEPAAVAAAAASALAEASPVPASIRLDLHGTAPGWVEMLCDRWPGGRGVWHRRRSRVPVPRILLGDYDTWMQERSHTFQREMRRKKRKLEGADGSFRYATAATLDADVCAFMRLHRSRLEGRGGTSLTDEGTKRMLVACGEELLASERFRLLCLEVDGKVVAAQLLVAAGNEVSGWNTGFDDDYAKLSPLMLCMIHSVADAARRGERVMSFGPGAQGYKYRLSNDEDALESHLLVPRGARYPLVRSRLAASAAAGAARRRLGGIARSTGLKRGAG